MGRGCDISEMQARGVNISILWADVVICDAPKEAKYKVQRGQVGGVTAVLSMPEAFNLHRGQFQCLLKSVGIFSEEHWIRLHGYVEINSFPL